ncbi:MAG: type II toxin-antitoxin system HicB family antitoxin [Dehalococcoidia bacterium]|nr:type II toxin-antitoxin system HicB family antitoxin [Dehalococcoidia bacterium]
MEKINYTIIIEPDEDEWLAYIPAVPGCYAPGDTPEEALQELDIVFEMIVEEYTDEGRPLPPDIEVEVSASKS